MIPALLLLSVLCIFAFGWSLSAPLLHDDYVNITFGSEANLQTIGNLFFRKPAEMGFRPLGFLSYYLDFQWAHFIPLRWHAWNLSVHILNCCLVYAVTRKLRFSSMASLLSGIIFAIHGTRAETVCWSGARFDLLATFFVLAALFCLLQYATKTGVFWLAASLFSSILAFASKESSFCLFFLLLVLPLYCAGATRARLIRAALPILVLSVLAFVYRWWMLGGIGGYQTNGYPHVLNFSAVRTIKALLWRTWAHLFFPINWTSGTGIWLSIAVVAYLALLAVTFLKARIDKQAAFTSIAFTVAACLPVQHLLLLGSDLGGSRFLYLPVLGFGLLWATMVDANRENPRIAYLAAAGLVFFNLAALEHNVATWRTVAVISQQVCRSFGQEIADNRNPVVVTGLPSTYFGVYFLNNGFPQCVQQNSGVPAQRIEVMDKSEQAPPKAQWFTWNPATVSFRKVQ